MLELSADREYRPALVASAGRRAAVPGCDRLALDLDALWAEVARQEA